MAYGEVVNDYITLDESNIEKEHICCAISSSKDQVALANTKKAWLKERMKDGLVFTKMNVRGKVFIEYMPAEKALAPITAPDYMYIDCFWVAGAYAKHGAGTALLNGCIEDAKAKGKEGLCVISSAKKKPYLTDPKYLMKKGFLKADEGAHGFILYYLPFSADAAVPTINDCAKKGAIDDQEMVIYYSNQCTFSKANAEQCRQMAEDRGLSLKAVEVATYEQAQKMPVPFTIYAFFDKGSLVTHVTMTEKEFQKYLDARQ